MLAGPPAPARKVFRQAPQTLLRRDMQVAVGLDVVSGDGFPEQGVRGGGLGEAQAINLDVCEGIGFLVNGLKISKREGDMKREDGISGWTSEEGRRKGGTHVLLSLPLQLSYYSMHSRRLSRARYTRNIYKP